jgi:hypothetical protein
MDFSSHVPYAAQNACAPEILFVGVLTTNRRERLDLKQQPAV